jgi:hypothetical protein
VRLASSNRMNPRSIDGSISLASSNRMNPLETSNTTDADADADADSVGIA